jgi:Holliday junction DNA helicase RuvB
VTHARIQTPERLADELELDRSLRPQRLEDFVGQPSLKEQLAISIEAAIARGEALDHVLLAGPPGLGKTTLAQIIAAELGAPFVQTAGPALERKADIAAFLTALEPGSVFFVDEIHRLQRALEETFYPAMEDRRLPITVGMGAGARVVTLDLPPFTLIGATTRTGLLTAPLRDRFGLQHRLEHYEIDDLATIVRRSSRILGVALEPDGALAIASRSRGTPRVANRLLKRVRDFAEVRSGGIVTADVADTALALLEIDELGLDRLDRELLRALCVRFEGAPVGLSTLAVTVGEEQDTVEEVYEPYLLQCGLLKRTPRGRAATRRAYAHLGLEPPAGAESLF